MPNIRQELLIEAPQEKVYSAITNQEGLSAWWTPDTTAKAEVNSISRFAFGAKYFKEMKVVELNPFEHVKWECITGAAEWVRTNIAFDLFYCDKEFLIKNHSEITGQVQQLSHGNLVTLLKFQHDDWGEYTPMFSECSYTWGQFLRSLKLFCETGSGRPFPEQHRVG